MVGVNIFHLSWLKYNLSNNDLTYKSGQIRIYMRLKNLLNIYKRRRKIMRNINKEKGITLIALIITIVVLLILAVVAINAVTGDGIIQHATNAKTESKTPSTK